MLANRLGGGDQPQKAAARGSAIIVAIGFSHQLAIKLANHPHNRETPMSKYKLEYIRLDGYTPVPSLRGKTQIKEFATFPTLEQLPLWGFDGSSTNQATRSNSDCILKPVAV